MRATDVLFGTNLEASTIPVAVLTALLRNSVLPGTTAAPPAPPAPPRTPAMTPAIADWAARTRLVVDGAAPRRPVKRRGAVAFNIAVGNVVAGSPAAAPTVPATAAAATVSRSIASRSIPSKWLLSSSLMFVFLTVANMIDDRATELLLIATY
jgi:hypothetical protein